MTSKAGKQAPYLAGIPVVSSTTERDSLFPTPDTDQRVMIRGTGDEYTYTGSAWFLSKAGTNSSVSGFTLRPRVAADGSTDDYSLIAAALSVASAFAVGNATGATVELPTGTCITNTPIIVPNYVRLIGQGRSATVIKAGASFPINAKVVRLGPGTANTVFGCRLENLAVYANNTAGSTCVYSTELNEQSGCRNVLAHGYMAYGFNVEDSGANFNDNFLFEDIEAASGVGCTGGVGFRYSGLKQGGRVSRVTLNRNDATVQLAGVQVVGTGAGGCHLQLQGVNAEGYTDGILFDTNGGGTVIGATMYTAGTNLVHIVGSQPVSLTALYRATGTNTVKNDILGSQVTSARVMRYDTSYSSDGYQVFTSTGTTSTDGNVMSQSNAQHTVKSTPTSGGASQSWYRLLDGNNDGWLIRFGANGTGDPLQFLPVTAGVAGSTVFQINDTGGLSGLQTSNGPVGTLTLGAAATTVVTNNQVTASSLIFLFPTNAAAGTLVSGSKSPYISAKSAGVSFTVATADATAAAGTETFNYLVLN